MNYTKPEITSLASASFVIQNSGGEKAVDPFVTDAEGLVGWKTIPAYEGDE
jgi:hypothetical protein